MHKLYAIGFSLLQAIACYTPKFLWDAFEGGLLRMIVMGLNLGICREEEKQAKKEVILGYLTSHLKVNTTICMHTDYFIYSNERQQQMQCNRWVLKRWTEERKKRNEISSEQNVKLNGVLCTQINSNSSLSIATILCQSHKFIIIKYTERIAFHARMQKQQTPFVTRFESQPFAFKRQKNNNSMGWSSV